MSMRPVRFKAAADFKPFLDNYFLKSVLFPTASQSHTCLLISLSESDPLQKNTPIAS
jgi:hypothetical protein